VSYTRCNTQYTLTTAYLFISTPPLHCHPVASPQQLHPPDEEARQAEEGRRGGAGGLSNAPQTRYRDAVRRWRTNERRKRKRERERRDPRRHLLFITPRRLGACIDTTSRDRYGSFAVLSSRPVGGRSGLQRRPYTACELHCPWSFASLGACK